MISARIAAQAGVSTLVAALGLSACAGNNDALMKCMDDRRAVQDQLTEALTETRAREAEHRSQVSNSTAELGQCRDELEKKNEIIGGITEKLISEMSTEILRDIMQEAGYEVQGTSEQRVDAVFQRTKVYAFVKNDRVWISSSFNNTSGKISLDSVNSWNVKTLFSRAYLNDEANVVIESDFDATRDVTRANVFQFVKRFQTTLAGFVQKMSGTTT